ncbi:hypothetical protein [Rhodopseudomonas palustris]|nr:hypothetical protein [Rhodopseudomonas palustris]
MILPDESGQNSALAPGCRIFILFTAMRALGATIGTRGAIRRIISRFRRMPSSRPVVPALLIASALNLALMVPGGFVETRDFSAYPAMVLGAFNVFLTVLGLGSLVLAYLVIRTGRAYGWAGLAGLAFVAVYLLDLGRIFPVTPNPMSTLLATLEWIGTALGAALAVSSVVLRGAAGTASPAKLAPPMPIVLGLVVVALIIVAFATKSAMGV